MRIAVGTRSFPKVSETFVLGPIRHMLEQGHDVRIFALRHGEREPLHPIVRDYALLERTHVFGPDTFLRRCFSSARRRPHGHFDAIYVHFGNVAEEFRLLRQSGVFSGPLYPVFHGYDISSRVREDRFAYASLLQECELALPISELWQERLVELGAPREKIEVHRMGIDLTHFDFSPLPHPVSDPQSSSPSLQLLSVARLVEKKGLDFALLALARFFERHPNLSWRYRIVGDGPLRAHLEKRASDLGLSSRVEFLGSQASDVVTELYRESHVFLLPSVTSENGDMEGLPVVLMEAMARGVAVIATRHSGIPELLSPEAGWLVSERDAEALAQALEDYLDTGSDLALRLNRARKAVETSHDVVENTNALLRCFRARSPSSEGRAS